MISTRDMQECIHNDILDKLDLVQDKEYELETLVSQSIDDSYPLMSSAEKKILRNDVINEVLGYGFLENILADTTLNEIMINQTSQVYVDSNSTFTKVDINVTKEDLFNLAQKIAGAVGSRCDTSSPILDAWLRDGSRVHVVLPPIAPDGPCITIRRFIEKDINLKQFCPNNAYFDAMQNLVTQRKNIVVAGATSSGKTTLLNCLMQEIPSFERVISVEETAELSCSHPHWVRLLSRPSNSEQAGEISLGDLVKATLRMRPDRIVVGEVRSIEAFDLMQALNTGHDGSLCTIHANGPLEVLSRLSSLALLAHPGLNLDSIKSQFCFGIDAIVFVSKDKTGKRTINSISYLNDIDEANVLFDFETGAKFNV